MTPAEGLKLLKWVWGFWVWSGQRVLTHPNPKTKAADLFHTQAAIRAQGVMGKCPHWTKIELCWFLLIPDEQVLLFKAPNPLQPTHWNPNTLSPALQGMWLPSFFCPFSLSQIMGRGRKALGRNLHEENQLKTKAFANLPLTEWLSLCAFFKHNSELV